MAVKSSGVGRRAAGAARRSSRSVGVFAAGVAVVALVSGCGADKDEGLTTPADAVTSGAPLPSGADSQTPTSTSSTPTTTSTSVSSNATGSAEDDTADAYTEAEQAEAVRVARGYFAALNEATINPAEKIGRLKKFYDSSCETCMSAQNDIQKYITRREHVEEPRFSVTRIRPDFGYERRVVVALVDQMAVPVLHEDGKRVGTTAKEKDVRLSLFMKRQRSSWMISEIMSFKGAV